ncbi:hypothetical protein LQZ18_18605 [Lachnospiraceae bacterium ZAX-1]
MYFYRKYKFMIAGGPIATGCLLLLSVLCYCLSWIGLTVMLSLVMINAGILAACCMSNDSEVNDIDLLLHYNEYKDLLLMLIWCNGSGGYGRSDFLVQKRREIIDQIISKGTADAYESIFLCNTIWDIYEQGMVQKERAMIDLLTSHCNKIKCKNNYWHYIMLCMLSIVNYDFHSENVSKIYNMIHDNQGILSVLKEDSSGVSYFVAVMENKMKGEKILVKQKLCKRARRKIGLEF